MAERESRELAEQRIGRVRVLYGERGGKYPSGNTLLVEGEHETVAIDPSLGLVARRDVLPRVDRVLNSHVHEDHVAGNHLFPEVPWHAHEADLPGLHSLEDFLAIFGLPAELEPWWREVVLETFHYTPRPDALPYRDGDVFELGGARVHVLHAPGHTHGHCCLRIEQDADDDVLYLGDIDLSSFGPYYGDAWSDLEAFERTLARVREERAGHYATFHHVGVLDGREAYLQRLDRFAAVIERRETRLLEFLAEPRTLEEVVAHRFVFRPEDDVPMIEPVERRSMGQHIARLRRDGRVRALSDGRFRAA